VKCPQCKTSELKPVEIEQGLVAAGCESCSGVMLSLLYYRYWKEQVGDSYQNDNVDQHVEANDSQGAKLCPKCNRLMTKYNIGNEGNNRVELCAGCDEAWLDSGEWELLKSLELHSHLPDIFTESWQRKIRKSRQEERWDQHFSAIIGETDFNKVKDFKVWLDDHEHRTEIMHYITTHFD